MIGVAGTSPAMTTSVERKLLHMINAAIVGLGRWGRNHVNAVVGSPHIRYVRAVTRNPPAAQDFAEQHRLALTTRFAEVLADPAIDAVVLATPHSQHVDEVVAAASAGKAVWCEKPLALTRAEAARAVDACRTAGVTLASGYNRRFFSSMRELERVVAGGALGDILHIEGHFSNEYSIHVVGGGWRDDPDESPALGMTGCGLHVLDALISLAGPIRQLDAKAFAQKPVPDPRDAVAVLAQFASGATGTMATVRASAPFWRVHVFGANGAAEARDEDTLRVALIGKPAREETFRRVDSLRAACEAFAQAVEHRTPFAMTPAELVDVTAAFEAVIASLATGMPVTVPA
jgi:predicted dehydrogenase